eukprot:gene27644-30610_t
MSPMSCRLKRTPTLPHSSPRFCSTSSETQTSTRIRTTMSDFVHDYADLNGLRYHFVTAGDGPAVLLLHGFPDLWVGWRPVMESLVARGYRVIAPDLRGFGETEAAKSADAATAIDVMGDLVALLDHLGIAPAAWRTLLTLPAATLLDAQIKIGSPPNAAPASWGGRAGIGAGTLGSFGAVRDGHVLPHHPFDPGAPNLSSGKPLMVGGNQEEQMFFSLVARDTAAWALDDAALAARMRQAFGAKAEAVIATYRGDRPGATPSDLYFAIQSDLFSGQGSTVIAERKMQQRAAPAFRYVLAYQQGGPVPGSSATMGALHAMDIPFKFNTVDATVGGRPPIAGPRPERHAMAHTMSRAWATFARTGIPAAPGLPAWPAYDLVRRPTMYLDVASHVVADPHRAERLFWERAG